jgi:protease-4
MGDYAASGGYYVSCAAHGVVAAPGTLTGSIGVIAAKPVAARLFEKLGVARARFERGPNSAMYSPAAPFTSEQRAHVERSIRHFYALFLRRVGEGRARPAEEVAPVAEGRVWTGSQALERGLVDRLGDEQVAIDWLAEKTGADAERGLLVLAPRVPWVRRLMPRLAGAWASLGPELGELWEVSRLVAHGESVLAWSPWRVGE